MCELTKEQAKHLIQEYISFVELVFDRHLFKCQQRKTNFATRPYLFCIIRLFSS